MIELTVDGTRKIYVEGVDSRPSGSLDRIDVGLDWTSRSQAPLEVFVDDVVVAAGGTLGRTVRLDEHGILLAEIFLERALDTGDTAMVEYSFSFTDVEDLELGTYAANRMANVSVWARFSRERLPRRGWRFTQLTDQDEDRAEVDLGPGASLHHALRSFGPGLMGIRWEW